MCLFSPGGETVMRMGVWDKRVVCSIHINKKLVRQYGIRDGEVYLGEDWRTFTCCMGAAGVGVYSLYKYIGPVKVRRGTTSSESLTSRDVMKYFVAHIDTDTHTHVLARTHTHSLAHMQIPVISSRERLSRWERQFDIYRMGGRGTGQKVLLPIFCRKKFVFDQQFI